MKESFPVTTPGPEEVLEAQAILAAQNETNLESGELDGLEELRAEVAADPVSTEAYLRAKQRLAKPE